MHEVRTVMKAGAWFLAILLALGCERSICIDCEGWLWGDAAPPACTPGEMRCDGAKAERCTGSGSGFVFVQECASEALCDRERGCQLPLCGVGETRCRDGVREGCSTDRTRWQTLGVCSGDITDAGIDAAADAGTVSADAGHGSGTVLCDAGSRVCDGARLLICDPSVGLAEVEQCASAALCDLSKDLYPASCLPPDPCSPGEMSCNGAVLQLCNTALTGWDAIATCASAELCDPLVGRCDQPEIGDAGVDSGQSLQD